MFDQAGKGYQGQHTSLFYASVIEDEKPFYTIDARPAATHQRRITQ